ncbi:MAG: NAD(P)-binding domain-containing protein [Deinococcota bacterium]|nr:NAD(P)-binding domain-containing protein [Deinococcota bacterium]
MQKDFERTTQKDVQKVAIIGAAGKMGNRISSMLKDDPDYELLYVEAGEQGEARLRERGVTPTPKERAVREADVLILAVPDTLIGTVAREVVPALKPGAMVMCLDPAAPYAGELPERADITYFLTHPSHPPIFQDDPDPEARRDYWGFGKAKQSIVNALIQGPEEDYARGEAIASKMFRPILRSHRCTLEQMAILEPVLSETVALTCVDLMREAMNEAVRRGVPPEAARDFLLGHINVELAIWFGELDWQPSAGAMLVLEEAKKQVLRPDWKDVFEPEKIKESVKSIVSGKLS